MASTSEDEKFGVNSVGFISTEASSSESDTELRHATDKHAKVEHALHSPTVMQHPCESDNDIRQPPKKRKCNWTSYEESDVLHCDSESNSRVAKRMPKAFYENTNAEVSDIQYDVVESSGMGYLKGNMLSTQSDTLVSPSPVGFQGSGNGNAKRKFDWNSDGGSGKSNDQYEANARSGNFLKSETGEPVKTKNQMEINPKIMNLMASMGYKEGLGLGKDNQGRVNIVEASLQRGRRGFGMKIAGLEATRDIDWTTEQVISEVKPDWMPPCKEDVPNCHEMENWIQEGPKKLRIDDETEFCTEKTLKDVITCKSVFDNLENEEMRRARTRSNPFETIRGVFFQNRAAMKMAEMNATFDFMFSDPKDINGKSLLANSDILYFADICAGPGGFSEYLIWKRPCFSKGFGFTLKGSCDFKLEEFFAAPSEFLEPHYGIGGREGTGDITCPDNLEAFQQFVMASTDNKGVYLVMGDGGFSVEGQENLQEILSKQLYLCQFCCTLSVLRVGGNFVCKLFDIFTPFSVGLIYLMYRCFRRVCIHKPVTSRPANSERYIVCEGLRENTEMVHSYLFEVNTRMNRYRLSDDEDVTECVPLHVMKDDEAFFEYIIESNVRLGQAQSLNLSKIKAFAQNPDLYEVRQSELRTRCLSLWQIPDLVRSAPVKPDPEVKFHELCKDSDVPTVFPTVTNLDESKLEQIESVFDYKCIVTASEPCYLLGFGRSHVFKYSVIKRKWERQELKVELPRDTLLIAEILFEIRGESKGQRKVTAIHIRDAMVLAGNDIHDIPYPERLELCRKFTKALHKATCTELITLKVKQLYGMEKLQLIFDKLSMRTMKGSGGRPRLCYQTEEDWYFNPTGVTFIKIVKGPWSIHWSKGARRKYVFNKKTRDSQFDFPKESFCSFKDCIEEQLHWQWESGVKLLDNQPHDESKLSRDAMIMFIHKQMPNGFI